ncbi:MAG: hypothetical protein AUF65_01610 [Chloroflexi bacterium 13_1_20CM_50_12]|nr:MAG: hypothetical protein AUF65_01610 [Chloroflexi bacterium 13_1_20CM_50_12]
MIHELKTDRRTITFDDQTGKLWIPADETDTIAHLEAREVHQLVTWLLDTHRDTLQRMGLPHTLSRPDRD